MEKIDNQYISNAINELISLLGINDEFPYELIPKSLWYSEVEECIKKIANYLGLPIAINLSYVSSQYQQGNTGSGFESSALATTDRAGRGVEGITAQVSIPSYLPLYGTSGLRGFPISVKISDNCVEHPETFMSIMAHELSHIVLHSLRHKEKDNELYTDLTAMILGFSKVMGIGRKVVDVKDKFLWTETLTTTYGYLSDKQFHFASNMISKIRRNNIESKKYLLKKLTAYRKQLSFYKKELFRFEKFVEYLDKNQNKTIREEDTPRIILFHQPNYIDEFTVVIRKNEEKLKEANDFCVGLLHYTQQRLDSLRIFHEEIDALISDLKEKFALLNSDVNTLGKYVGFFYKRKVNQQTTPI